jgi:LysM repeat protein
MSILGIEASTTNTFKTALKVILTIAVIVWVEMNFHPLKATGRAADVGGQTWITTAMENYTVVRVDRRSGSATPVASWSTKYRVVRGDSLSRISGQFGVSVKDLQKANSMGKSTLIKPGQLLNIPSW